MKQFKFKSSWEIFADPNFVNQGEVNSGEVITMPDQALSPQQILVMFNQGRIGDLPQFKASFLGDNAVLNRDFTKMDKMEREEYLRSLQGYINSQQESNDSMMSELKKVQSDYEQYNREQEFKAYSSQLNNKGNEKE